MNDVQLEAFVAAAEDGVDRDGLSVAYDGEDDTYTFATLEKTRERLDDADLRSVAAENPWYVSNWYFWDGEDRPDLEQAFLRWLEGAEGTAVPDRYEALADGLSSSWGQLHLEVELGDDGNRIYHLRHEDDAGAEPAALDVHTDPHSARELVKYDEKGRYRPLKTAPSLPSGWAFVDLDGRALTRTVDLIYPATIANWHLERVGELDVEHYRGTAERQTGIYDVVERLPKEAVEWAAEACCVDSQCLKRRMWDEDEETELDVPRGGGEFPCREPCSLVIAAARKWTMLEEEESRIYEFELTPSEKEQLEAIVEAVAEDRIDEIREADVYEGANRYRTRYLRAKRFDEEGRLSGTPTDQESR